MLKLNIKMQIKEIKSIKEILSKYSVFIFDQWGVLHDGKKIFQGVESLLDEIKYLNKEVFILSNSGKSSADNLVRLNKMGSTKLHNIKLITSGDICLNYLIQNKYPLSNIGYNYFNIGTYYNLLGNTNFKKVKYINKANFLLLTTTTRFKNYDLIENQLESAIKLNLPLVCSNPDIYGVLGNKIHKSTGDIAIRYKEKGGTAHIIGKPGIEAFKYIIDLSISKNKKKMIMIGDSLFNDIAGANNFGIDSLLIKNGIHRSYFSKKENYKNIIKNIKSNFQLTGTPTYIIDKLI